jgi:polar amino acid transport system permease protein
MFNEIAEFFTTAFKYLPNFSDSILMTLSLSFWSIILGTVIGVIVCAMKMSKLKLLGGIAGGYIALIRGTPLLLQLFFIYYGLPQAGIYFNSYITAVLGLAFHNGAYISEIFRGSILSIPYGQQEAASAMGMTRPQAFGHVIFPQAFKVSVPALGNQFLLAILDSSLASVITITETMMKAKKMAAATYAIFPIYFDAAIIYMVLTYALGYLLKKLEQRLRVNER